MKRSIRVAENLQPQGGLTNNRAIGFDLRSRFRSLNQNFVSHGPIWAGFRAWRKGLAPCDAHESHQNSTEKPIFVHRIRCLKETAGANLV